MNPAFAQLAAFPTQTVLSPDEASPEGIGEDVAGSLSATSERNGQMLPIADILPDVLRRYNLPLPSTDIVA